MSLKQTELVTINPRGAEQGENAGGMSRRKFLKVLGAASAVGAVGCADSAKQKVFPNVKGEADQVPGVAVWYRSACTECSAGCGITVRTREGRAVKVEGNPENPINKGSLCALGQSSLQALYDPDRIRQPLKRVSGGENPKFEPISWEAAYKEVSTALAASSGKGAVLTGELAGGAIEELITDWTKSHGLGHVVHDVSQPTALAKASELVYGTYGIPTYEFDKAEVILNFGADFLETWVSPCEYARGWANTRRSSHPARVIHVEPRLSLTGANADLWVSAKPGTEVQIALAVLKILLELGRGENLSSEVREKLVKLVGPLQMADVAEQTGVTKERILLIARYLQDAKSSLIVAGGAAASTNESLPLMVATSFLNLVLSNVGRTVNLAGMRKPRSSLEKLSGLIAEMEKGECELLLVHGANPHFSVPADYGFRYALKKVKMVVSFSSHLDETTQQAHLILPSHHSLEDWGDSRPLPGVYNIIQPSMTPVFDTRGFGDSLLKLAKAELAGAGKSFREYLQESWKKLHGELTISTTFDTWWKECVERGGYYDSSSSKSRVKVKVSDEAVSLPFQVASFTAKDSAASDLVLLPYMSVKSFDGRAANRPWLQELPDPITQAMWDAWAEIHPTTADKIGVKQGDLVTVRNHYGEINVPAYVSDQVRPDVVAVPLGQGHTAYGRYAQDVSRAGNPYDLLSSEAKDGDGFALFSTKVGLTRGPGKVRFVTSQETRNQYDRELARTSMIGAGAAHAAGHGHGDAHADHGHHGDSHGGDGHHGGGHGHHGHHEPKQMYEQRKHPVYEWGMAVDLAACTGCSACVVACYAENNIPVVGREVCYQGREMSWLRIERYDDHASHGADGGEELQVSFLPMMCQHCNNAPCEPVCPVYATYHNEEGLNVMAYNRCVGTRYCSNNCSYKVRRYNWWEFDFPEPSNLQLNPDVTKRAAGVMEKCSFCVQRITEAKDRAKDEGRLVEDGEVQPACVQGCPTQALAFGNLNDPHSKVSKLSHDKRAYKVLDHHLNTQPAVSYLENVRYKVKS